jgi:hypothetical protein
MFSQVTMEVVIGPEPLLKHHARCCAQVVQFLLAAACVYVHLFVGRHNVRNVLFKLAND